MKSSRSKPNLLYMLASMEGGEYYLGKYSNADSLSGHPSQNWINLTGNMPKHYESFGAYTMLLSVHPLHEDIVFIGGTSLYRSVDGFKTPNYTQIFGGNLKADYHNMVFSHSDTNKALVSCDQGIYYLEDLWGFPPNNFTNINRGFHTAQYYTVAINHFNKNDDLIIGGMQDNGTKGLYLNSEKNAFDIFGGDGSYCAIDPSGKIVTASAQWGTIFRVDLTNNNYVRIDPFDANIYGISLHFINPFIIDPNNYKALYTIGKLGIWRNSDITAFEFNEDSTSLSTKTKNWERIESTVQNEPRQITALGMSYNPPNILYYSTYTSYGTGIYKLINASNSQEDPIQISTATIPELSYINCINVDQSNSDIIMISVSNYGIESIYITRDGGKLWEPVGGNLEDKNGPSVKWVSGLNVNDKQIYFAGTTTGLFVTDLLEEKNTIWYRAGESLIGNLSVSMIKVREQDNLVVVATHGGGIYYAHYQNFITNIEKEISSKKAIELSNNFPNPFNPSTTIVYTLNKDQNIKLNIYNISGQLIKSLVHERKEKGTWEAIWDGTNYNNERVSSGVYFYKLATGNKEIIKKMLLLR